MSTFFYRRPRATVLLVLLILVDGLAGLLTLPRMEDPVLSPRAALIVTRYPGASAERVEALVTIPIEQELAEVEELKLIRTDSRPGLSTVVVEVKDDLNEFVSVWSRVRDALSDAETVLPPGALRPDFEEREARAYAALIALKWDSEAPFNSAVMARYGKELEDLLRALPGTEKVDNVGLPVEELQVLLDPEQLSRYRLTPGGVAAQIAAFDVKSSSGRLINDNVDLLFELPELENFESFTKIYVRSDDTGRNVPLNEVARFHRGEEHPPRDKVLIEGERSVVVAAKVLSNRRVDLWARDLRPKLQAFQQALPQGIELKVLFDQSTFTAGRLHDLQRNVLIGAVLVAIVVFLFMGWRSALAVSAALPLTTLVVLEFMKMLSVPIHQMSVTGLIIALGLLIDNAIVIVDELQQALDSGAEPIEAIRSVSERLFMPLLSSTVTTVLAFMPLILMPGPAGEFVGSISITVIAALLGSLFLSLSIIPVFYVLLRLYLPSLGSPDRPWNKGLTFPPLARQFERTLRWAFRAPLLGIIIGLVLPVTGFAVAPQLQEQFFPPSDRRQCEITLELASGTSLEHTEKVVREVRDFLLARPEVERVDWYLARSTPAFYYNLLGTRQGASNYAQAMLVFKDGGELDLFGAQRRLQNELDRRFPQARLLVRQLEQGPPFEAPVELQLYGPDLNVLREKGAELRLLLSEIKEVTHTQASLDEDLVTLRYTPDDTQVRTAGLTPLALSNFMRDSTQGVIAGSLLEDAEQVQVRVRLDDQSRQDLRSLATLEPLPQVPLEQYGAISLRSDRAVITRRDRRRTNTVHGFLQSGVLPSTALTKLKEKLADSHFELPTGYELRYGGEAEKRDEAVGNLLGSAGTLLVLMTATLVLGFSSFRMAGIIGLVAFFSVGLSLGALYLFGYPFGFMAIIGTLGLIGIAINDSIVVLAALREDPEAGKGDPEASVRVVLHCSRHVLATSATTVVGFLPLFLSGGSFWPPLAVAIGGGVSGATIMALYFVPALFRLIRR